MFSPEEENKARINAKQNLLWVSLVSVIMLFAGLTSAYVVRMAEGNWEHLEMPVMFYISTAIILLSSITMNMAMNAAKKNNQAAISNFIWITFALGLAFIFFQVSAWSDFVSQGIFFAGKDSSASGAYLYVLSGVHLAHVIGGLIVLIFVGIKSLRGAYDSENRLGLKMAAIYWHFLDILWIYLFLFLLFIR